MPSIPVEAKHTYNSYEAIVHANVNGSMITYPEGSFRSVIPLYPDQGTDANQRVGRKIKLDFISEEGTIGLDTSIADDTMLAYWDLYLQAVMTQTGQINYDYPVNNLSFDIPIRHMIVDFQDEEMYNGTNLERALYLSDWYKNLVIQAMPDPASNASNQTRTLRESTQYTGRFNILKDDLYWLNLKNKHHIHFQYKLPIKYTINFEEGGATREPSNHHIYSIWIGPLNPSIDYNNRPFGIFLNDSEGIQISPSIAIVDSTMKLSYTDI